ncbi:hypothetical protein ACWGGS_01690 [Streptomyces decoyicus]
MTWRTRGAEPPAQEPVVVRIGRVELIAPPPAPAVPRPPAAASERPPAPVAHPDLLAAHRHHSARRWSG